MSESLQVIFGPSLEAAFMAALLRANLVMGTVFLIVLALRPVLRRYSVGYSAWLLPPVAGFLAPLTTILHDDVPDPLALALAASPDVLRALTLTWLVGALAVAALFAVTQAFFMDKLRKGQAGPAVVGFFAPRIVMPAELTGFTTTELDLIRAHEREHVARKDTRALTGLAVLQCVGWFNPTVHMAAGLLRLDQEIACDAAVVLKRPGSRTLYARTLLKSQTLGATTPLACYWQGLRRHPLEHRIGHLRRSAVADSSAAVHAVAAAIRP
jgi:beta-lactamase regulating signal transducer with metallopeptidase domain